MENVTNRDSVPLAQNTSSSHPAAAPGKVKTGLIYLAIALSGMLTAKVIIYFLGTTSVKQSAYRKPVCVSAAANLPVKALISAEGSVTPALSSKQTSPTVPAGTNNTITKPKEATPPSLPMLILNGIFLSSGEEFAIINNQIVKSGDEIEGAVVQKIEAETVKLEYFGKTITLTTIEN